MPPRRPQPRRPITAATMLGFSMLILPTFSIARLSSKTGTIAPILYTGAISTLTFVMYGYDKMQARNLEWRVKEATLHFLELLGGWPGALIGQHYFQHKTKKASFQVVFWVIVLGWQLVWWAIYEDAEGVMALLKEMGKQEVKTRGRRGGRRAKWT
ncbi:hypothetical protein BCR34DRAFT_115782 [Clohesyomyces aquaticus]|uniref:DUF1294-domain-containing protein n=1 Tax=Clohesyomyces aquaticus TaxID=1231657 RepID=A0A1Y1YQE0_9PLEO|nr:hypothetical protein BCR34DRAFT_115782 [Clohesyomyces aquaticus]